MSKPDWHHLELAEGILRERTPEATRLIVWLPVHPDNGDLAWERIANVSGASVRAEQRLFFVPATSIRVRQPARGFFARLWQRFQKPADGITWVLPNGRTAAQEGERQTDLLLVWSDQESLAVEEARIQALWPRNHRIQRIGKNLFLVAGVDGGVPETAPAPPPPANSCKQARQLLAAAREAGDRPAEVSALTDLGAVTVHSGDAQQALVLLEAALKLARDLGDRSAETDVLANLGLAAKAARQPGRALEVLGQALAYARAGGDRFAEKLTLDHLASVYATQRDHARALATYEQALALARDVGHRQHEADLLWVLAIHHAELGRRDDAVALAQGALGLFTQMGNPQVRLLADHLHQYQREGTGTAYDWTGAASSLPHAGAVSAGASLPGAATSHQGTGPGLAEAVSGPRLLRMAYSAAKSMARFVGSGLKTVAPVTQQQRLQTCAQCAHHTGVRCKLCGCFTSVKTRLPHETCPLGKWPA